MDVAALGQRAQDVQMAGGKPGEAEQRNAPRDVDGRRVLAQPRARAVAPLRRTRQRDPRPQASPVLGLPRRIRRQRATGPVGVAPARPGADHLRPMERVAIEQFGQMPDPTDAPRVAHRVAAPAIAALLLAVQVVLGEIIQVVLDESQRGGSVGTVIGPLVGLAVATRQLRPACGSSAFRTTTSGGQP